MARKQEYRVKLSQSERDHLKNLISTGTEKARKLARARILLKANAGWTDEQTANALDIGMSTIGRIRKRYATEGLDVALNRKPTRREYERKIDGAAEAQLIALTCGEPPEGYARWSLRLLAKRLVALEQVEIKAVSHETVRQVLKKTNSSPGGRSNG